ncbi:uncharacterized protein [Linepithema humile]|uniref:uncharacterized protein n=1 Tax=Linepithema humile TaxID=83485 RepID=UPI0006237CC2|nr:PREDICTED: uncharacterized protein LOC105671416 [Linepithema humile]
MIFGKTKLYWDEWKKQWDEQLNEWTSLNVEKSPPSVSPNEEDTRIKFDDENSVLERQASAQKRQRISDVSASMFPLLNLSKTSVVDRSLNRVRKDIPLSRARDRRVARRTDDQCYQRRAFIRSLYEQPEATNASRKKHRAKNLADALQADVPAPRRRSSRVASVDLSALVKAMLVADDEKTTKRFEHESPKNAKPRNTARERRREHLKINLE